MQGTLSPVCSEVGFISLPRDVCMQGTMTYLLSLLCTCENAVWASKLVEWGTALATKPDDLSLVPGAHVVEEEN